LGDLIISRYRWGCAINIILSRRTLFLGLFIAIIASDSIIFFAEIKSKDFYSNWIITINASIAAGLAVYLVYKQKFRGLHGKTHAALAAGLVLWLSADIIWAIYQLVLDVVPPIPSAADYLWLGAYGFLGYYLFMTYKEFQKKFNFGRKALIASVIGNAIFLGYIIALTVNLSVLSTSRGIEMFAVIVAYPILDATLMIPAIVILVEFRKEPVWFIPWICESLGIFNRCIRQLVCTYCSNIFGRAIMVIGTVFCSTFPCHGCRIIVVYQIANPLHHHT
jgi:hypothetical protein